MKFMGRHRFEHRANLACRLEIRYENHNRSIILSSEEKKQKKYIPNGDIFVCHGTIAHIFVIPYLKDSRSVLLDPSCTLSLALSRSHAHAHRQTFVPLPSLCSLVCSLFCSHLSHVSVSDLD